MQVELLQHINMNYNNLKKWYAIAASPDIIKRAIGYALVVGFFLILINHGACILENNYTQVCFLQSLLSMLVPYIVVTFSSVQAIVSNHSNNQ